MMNLSRTFTAEVADSLFENFKNEDKIKKSFKYMQLSHNTVMRHIESISQNVNNQLLKDTKQSVSFSLQLNKYKMSMTLLNCRFLSE